MSLRNVMSLACQCRDVPPGRLCDVVHYGLLALGLTQYPGEYKAQQHAKRSEQVKAGPPAIVLSQYSSDGSTGRRSDVNAGLVSRHGTGACRGSVVVAYQRHGSRKIESFAQALQRTKDYKVQIASRQGRRDGDQRPEDETGDDHCFSAEA